MRTDDLDYDLPSELIAQEPAESRCESRLLVMDRATGKVRDDKFADVVEYIECGDCLVLNNTKVLPARFFAHRISGAKLEGLFLRKKSGGRWEVMLKNSRKVNVGEEIILSGRDRADRYAAVAVERYADGRWLLEITADVSAEVVLDEIGYAPLPPYIKRGADDERTGRDLQRYQTVYAEKCGAVAAPTAGLHFTDELLGELAKKGVKMAYITLHVGAGTFKPVVAERLEDHQMHFESFELADNEAEVINDASEKGGRIIAVGTTSVRTLETIAKGRRVECAAGKTDLFIKPGYEFKLIDAMVTNFHLPRSTLLALVGAFAGLDNVLAAYRHAVEKSYRFYSYGDAMLIL